ncbi:unnamed protein product [Adineta steineri]|uniref:Nucleoside diphosphate kinase n=1 Tax=Adineta steineri TaxID=433720 RepID=A0A814HL06_9BILA|nr:unnamed protein product [Adineta steineri]CAF3886915.1 unnamed protein product [Adineta steineri]
MAATRERSLILVKHDGVQRGLVGEVIRRFENRGFKLIGLKYVQATRAQLESHYEDHKGKDFFEPLLAYGSSGPAVAMVWEGHGVITAGRAILGATDPIKAQPGTVRGDYATAAGRNLVHGSDSEKAAKREVDLWFKAEELLTWHRAGAQHLHDKYSNE